MCGERAGKGSTPADGRGGHTNNLRACGSTPAARCARSDLRGRPRSVGLAEEGGGTADGTSWTKSLHAALLAPSQQCACNRGSQAFRLAIRHQGRPHHAAGAARPARAAAPASLRGSAGPSRAARATRTAGSPPHRPPGRHQPQQQCRRATQQRQGGRGARSGGLWGGRHRGRAGPVPARPGAEPQRRRGPRRLLQRRCAAAAVRSAACLRRLPALLWRSHATCHATQQAFTPCTTPGAPPPSPARSLRADAAAPVGRRRRVAHARRERPRTEAERGAQGPRPGGAARAARVAGWPGQHARCGAGGAVCS